MRRVLRVACAAWALVLLMGSPFSRAHAAGLPQSRIPVTDVGPSAPEDPSTTERVISGIVSRAGGHPQKGAVVRFVWLDRGQEKEVHTRTDRDGHFRLHADAKVNGALHASLGGYGTSSAAIDPVTSGTTGHRLRLRVADTLEFEVRDMHGNEVRGVRAKFFWELAGCSVLDHPGPRPAWAAAGEGLWWERPSVPFSVHVVADGYQPGEFGPFDPQEVQGPLVLQLIEFPHVRGRVLCDGRPVAKASVELGAAQQARTMNLERLPYFLRPGPHLPGAWGRTDDAGNYDLELRRAGTYMLRAWSPTSGLGIVETVELDPASPPQSLDIELTQAPGSIAGKVLFPEGHGPGELLLSTSTRGGYISPASDGSFLLPNLPPGPTRVVLRRGSGSSDGPVSTTISRDAGNPWIYMSHGPGRAPEWLRSEPTFEVQVVPGEQAALTIDLTRTGACVLEGQVLLNGAPPVYVPRERGGWYIPPTPRVILDSGDGQPYASRAEIDPQGRFQLQTSTPGSYRLRIELCVGEDLEWDIVDVVQLEPGTRSWIRDFSTGSARVFPGDKGWNWPIDEGALRWRGPGELRVFLPWPRYNWAPVVTKVGPLFFEAVPSGTVQFLLDSEGGREVLIEQEIRAGAETTMRRP